MGIDAWMIHKYITAGFPVPVGLSLFQATSVLILLLLAAIIVILKSDIKHDKKSKFLGGVFTLGVIIFVSGIASLAVLHGNLRLFRSRELSPIWSRLWGIQIAKGKGAVSASSIHHCLQAILIGMAAQTAIIGLAGIILASIWLLV
jgi:hypothetical protein